MGVTIRDVAKEAGVSATTVSRVFNHEDLVTEKTRERVRRIAREMGYQPNATAKSLSHGRTDAIGIVLPAPHGEFFSEIIRGVDEVAQASGHYLLISSSHYSFSESEAAFQALQGRVDGLLVMTTHVRAKALLESVSMDIPMVLINTALSDVSYDAFDIENRSGARKVVDHLLDQGYESIGVIEGPLKSFDVQERLQGHRDALEAAGIDPDAQVRIEGDFTQESGYAAGKELLKLDRLPDAVFALNDYMAIGAMAALQEAGVRIPADLAIAGFDDIPSARYASPSLTTVRIPVYDLGRCAAERLLRRIHRDPVDEPRAQTLPSELKVRASTVQYVKK